jgi:hypothetical protein
VGRAGARLAGALERLGPVAALHSFATDTRSALTAMTQLPIESLEEATAPHQSSRDHGAALWIAFALGALAAAPAFGWAALLR